MSAIPPDPSAFLDPHRRHSRRGDKDTSAHLLVRRKLFDMVRDILERDGHSGNTAAPILNTSRARAYALIRGEMQLFNSETLIDMLARLGVMVEIIVTREQRYARHNITRKRPGWRPPPRMSF